MAGSDLYFNAWGRPFKFVGEAYYKYINNLIPYSIDNLKISYYGTNDAFGYATGVDFRVNGEFVKGIESWASLSIMKTEENINGDWIPRPTDQRVNLSIFFQDYIPHYPSWRMNLTLFYGTGLAFRCAECATEPADPANASIQESGYRFIKTDYRGKYNVFEKESFPGLSFHVDLTGSIQPAADQQYGFLPVGH